MAKWYRINSRTTPNCMQAVIAWEHENVPEKERTGYIDKGKKEEGEERDSHLPEPEFKPIRFI